MTPISYGPHMLFPNRYAVDPPDGPDTVTCPQCGEDRYAVHEPCPHCGGEWPEREDEG